MRVAKHAGVRLVVIVLPLLIVPALAAAQPGPDDPSPPGLTPPIAAPAPRSPLDQADLDDAAADRAYGTSTALVVPGGRVDLSVRGAQGAVLFSAAVGVGHGIEISGQLGGAQGVALVGGDLKIAVARTRTWALALDAGYHVFGVEDGGGGAFNIGGAASYASDSAMLSFGAGLFGAGDGGAAPYADASLIVGRGPFRPILEGAMFGSPWWFGGARMGNGHVCLDVGVGGGGAGDGASGVGPVPLVGLTVRP